MKLKDESQVASSGIITLLLLPGPLRLCKVVSSGYITGVPCDMHIY